MTRTAVGTPGEPDDPKAESTDAETDRTVRDYLEFLRQQNPVFRPATYADKDEMFLVRNKDGTHTAMVLEFKTHLTGSMSWSTAIRSSPIVVDVVPRLDVRRSWYARLSPQKLTKLAVFIAGRERAAVASEWRSHLSGEGGSGLPADRQVREAAGFVLAAIQYRVQDIVDLAWKPADAVLASRKLSNMVVFFATLIIALIYVHQGGPYELADNVGGVGVTWGAAFGLIHVGRQWRGVKPPQRKPRRTNQ